MSVSLKNFFPLTEICDRALTYLFTADSSPASALERAVYHCRGEADRGLLSGRIQIIKWVLHEHLTCLNLLLPTFTDTHCFRSAWRPLFSPLQDWPLAVCDSRSVDIEQDFITSDSVFPNNVAETLQVFYNKAHSWWFLSDQRRDEVLLFKIFDTNETVARCKWTRIKVFDRYVCCVS